jgi:polyisoprenoid-binding protein YceI
MARRRSLGIVLAAGCVLAAVGPARAQSVSTDYAAAPAGTYALDKAHTSVTLKVSHLGLSSYTLRLGGVQGRLTYDPAHPEASRLDVQIDANAVETGDPAFNRQIADQVLDAPHDPVIRFVATAIKIGTEGHGQVVGDLTLHGQTHPVTLDVIFNGFAALPKDHTTRLGFTANATVPRGQFGAVAYEPLVGDEVSVMIETEFVK